MKSTNPVFRNDTFKVSTPLDTSAGSMSIQGTVNKAILLLVLTLLTSAWTWNKFFIQKDFQSVVPILYSGAFGGFICAIIITFKKEWSPTIAPIYALLEGLFIGGATAFFEYSYPGIALQAASLTFGALAMMLLLYKSRIIKVTDKLRMGITTAVGAICFIYIISSLLSFFGVTVGFVHDSSPMGILFSLIVVGVAAFSMILDFDMIEEGERCGAPKYMEWYSAFALMVSLIDRSLIWLYINILRLLSKLREINK